MKKIFIALITLSMLLSVYGCKNPSSSNTNEKGVITWYGLEDQSVSAGDKVDLKQGLSVVDTIDGDITSKVAVLNDVDNADELEAQGWLDDYVEFDSNMIAYYEVYYRVENTTGVKEYKKRIFIVSLGHNVANGDFSLGKYGWTFHAPGGTATFDVNEEKNAEIKISNPGSEWWAIQLFQNVILKKGVTYKTTVVAKSQQGKAISFSYENVNDNYKMLMGGILAEKTTAEFSEYNSYYTATDDFYSAKAVLYLGYQLENDIIQNGQEQEVIIKSIYIEEVEVCPEVVFSTPTNLSLKYGAFTTDMNDAGDKTKVDLMEGVTATADGQDITDSIEILGEVTPFISGKTNFIVTYLVKLSNGKVAFTNRRVSVDFVRELPYEIINDDFKTGLAAWTVDINKTDGRGEADFVPTSEGMQVTIKHRSSALWHIMLVQSGIRFTNENTYLIKIRIKAQNISANANQTLFNIEVAENVAGIFTSVCQLETAPALTEEYQEYTLEYAPEVNVDAARIGFLCGTVAVDTVITISSFTVEILQ